MAAPHKIHRFPPEPTLRASSVLLAILLIATGVSAQSIRVYTDAAGTECTGFTTNGILQGSVWVHLGGAAAEGITGAEFRIDATRGHRGSLKLGFTSSYTTSAPVAIGDLFLTDPDVWEDPTTGGINFAFQECQTESRVHLATFTVLYLDDEDIWLNVRRHARGSNYGGQTQPFACPLVTLCDGPAFTKVCVGEPSYERWSTAPIHTYAVVNPVPGASHDCLNEVNAFPTSVSESGWSAVKSLYR